MPFQKGNKLARGGARPHSGRSPAWVRELCRKAFIDRLPTLRQIIDDPKTGARDRVAALALLARVGVPAQSEVSGPEGKPIEIAVELFEMFKDLPPEQWPPALLVEHRKRFPTPELVPSSN